jgi:hypothetical protein
MRAYGSRIPASAMDCSRFNPPGLLTSEIHGERKIKAGDHGQGLALTVRQPGSLTIRESQAATACRLMDHRAQAPLLHIEARLTSNKLLGLAVMSPLSEHKLVSLLAEIQSDIRQIKSDLQALVMLLKQQEKTPTSFSDGDHMADPCVS